MVLNDVEPLVFKSFQFLVGRLQLVQHLSKSRQTESKNLRLRLGLLDCGGPELGGPELGLPISELGFKVLGAWGPRDRRPRARATDFGAGLSGTS